VGRYPQASWPLMMRYPIAIESRTDQTAYGVVVPDLSGCFSAGDTLEEVIAGAEEAALAWIEAALDAGDPIPPPSSLEAIRAKPEFTGWILSLVTVDPAVLDDTVERVNITLYRVGCCGAWMTKRVLQARRDRAISRSSPSSTEIIQQ
jgi:predicted RNase H-like HicB family nuclease